MTHLTLNTRHAGEIPAGMVTPQTAALLAPLLKRGRGRLPGQASAYTVEIVPVCAGGAIYSFWRGRTPLSTNGFAATPEAARRVWAKIEKLWLKIGDAHPTIDLAPDAFLPEAPPIPWIATVMLFGLAAEAPEMVAFIGHMAGCFAVLLEARHRAP